MMKTEGIRLDYMQAAMTRGVLLDTLVGADANIKKIESGVDVGVTVEELSEFRDEMRKISARLADLIDLRGWESREHISDDLVTLTLNEQEAVYLAQLVRVNMKNAEATLDKKLGDGPLLPSEIYRRIQKEIDGLFEANGWELVGPPAKCAA